MKKIFAIILFAGLLTMNMDMVFKSLCMAAHTGFSHSSSHAMAKDEMHGEDACHGHHSSPQTHIKCGCFAEDEASFHYELALSTDQGDLAPHLYIISKTHSMEPTFLSKEPIPLEGPPKILA